MQYRRARVEGGTYFFTVVTYKRNKTLGDPANVSLLREAFRYVMERHPFVIDAAVVLPEHLHCMWSLPAGDRDFSMRWRLVKTYFSRKCDAKLRQRWDKSREKKKERTIWQRRFWEHLIRDDEDFLRHVEYIHYNPVKHGLVLAPKYWKYSSFHRYVRDGLYDVNWGAGESVEVSAAVGRE